MEKYIIKESTKNEVQLVQNSLIKYSLSKIPSTQEPDFISINRVIKDTNGNGVILRVNTIAAQVK